MKISQLLNLNTGILEPIISKIRYEAPPYLTPNRRTIKKKLIDLNNWYRRLIGLEEIQVYQDRVDDLQERWLTTQQHRRDIGRHLSEIRRKSKQLHAELNKLKQHNDLQKFVKLMEEEMELSRLQEQVADKFQEYDQMERDLFTAFTNAARVSYEKQRTQSHYWKYIGLILGIIGSLLTLGHSKVEKNDWKANIPQNMTATVQIKSDQASTKMPIIVDGEEVRVRQDALILGACVAAVVLITSKLFS